MFYNNNDNYMQDLYFYNQIPNGTYNPYMNQISNNQNPYIANGMVQNNMNSMMPNNMNGMMANNMMQNGMYPNQNLNNLYPSLYRVMMPVISRVISSNNIQFLNEDTLNNMVDTLLSILIFSFLTLKLLYLLRI